jgi:hypothetical protein
LGGARPVFLGHDDGSWEVLDSTTKFRPLDETKKTKMKPQWNQNETKTARTKPEKPK